MENKIKLDLQLFSPKVRRNIEALSQTIRKAQGFDVSQYMAPAVRLHAVSTNSNQSMRQRNQRTQVLIEGLQPWIRQTQQLSKTMQQLGKTMQQWNQRAQTFLAVARDELAVPKETSVVAYLIQKADRKELYFLLERQLECAMSVEPNFAVSILTENKQFDDALQSKNPCKLLPYLRQDNLFFLTEQAKTKRMAACFKSGEWHEKSEGMAAMWRSLFLGYNESVSQQTCYHWRDDEAFMEELEKRGIDQTCLQTSVEAPESSTGTTTRQAADEAKNKRKRGEKPQPNFKTIIQPINGKSKDEILARLHELIDGKKDSDVGVVILKFRQEKYITKNPSEEMMRKEFGDIGKWGSVRNYFNSNYQNAAPRAEMVVTF